MEKSEKEEKRLEKESNRCREEIRKRLKTEEEIESMGEDRKW